jgi:hypothetical protein
MTAQAVLEGTWEEILEHSPELSGSKVRLTVVEPASSSPVRSSRDMLLVEYHALTDLERNGGLSGAQAARLRSVDAQLDVLEEQNPAVRALYRRLDEDNDKLDEILAMLRDRSTIR